MRTLKTVLKTIVVLSLLVVVGIAVLLGLLWLDHTRETALLMPTGPFAVGRTQYAWRDSAHLDPLAPQPDTKRQLVVWIWYPAAPQQPQQKFDDYLPAPWRAALERQSGALLTQFLTRDLSRVQTHSTSDAEVSPQQHSYPVVLMRGGHSALTTDYTTLAEDLRVTAMWWLVSTLRIAPLSPSFQMERLSRGPPRTTPSWSAGKRG